MRDPHLNAMEYCHLILPFFYGILKGRGFSDELETGTTMLIDLQPGVWLKPLPSAAA